MKLRKIGIDLESCASMFLTINVENYVGESLMKSLFVSPIKAFHTSFSNVIEKNYRGFFEFFYINFSISRSENRDDISMTR